eukprot:NODE_314_length_11212_cov_0.272924.p1 type:complete len:888 gc:universal NODE_314_length_11212_cov_0.272924:7134-9797(+)
MTNKFIIVIYDFSGDSSQGELTVKEKDVLLSLDQDNDWILAIPVNALIDNLHILSLSGTMDEKLEKVKSLGGIVPASYVTHYSGDVGYSCHDYTPQDADELQLTQNESLQLFPTSDVDWSIAIKNNKIGLVPKTYVALGNPAPVPKFFEQQSDKSDDIFMAVMDTAPMNIKYHQAVHIPNSASSRKQGTEGALGISNSFILFVNLKVLTIYKQFPLDSSVIKSNSKTVQIQDAFFKLNSSKSVDELFSTLEDAKSGKSVERDLVKETLPSQSNSSDSINKASIKVLHDTVQKTASGTTKSNPAPTTPQYATALFQFIAQDKDELSIEPNQFLLTFNMQDDWVEAQLLSDDNTPVKDKRGYVPFNFLQKLEKAPAPRISPPVIPVRSPIKQIPVHDEHRLPPRTEEELKPVNLMPRSESIPPAQHLPVKVSPEQLVKAQPVKIPARADPVPQLPVRQSEHKAENKLEIKPERLESQVEPVETKPSAPRLPSRSPINKPQLPSRPPIPSRDNNRQLPPRSNNKPIDSELQSSPTSVPNPNNIRTWKDKSGGFSVAAEYLGVFDGKVCLFKSNGVKIGVPLSKLCREDVEFVNNQNRPKENTVNTAVDEGIIKYLTSCGIDNATCLSYASIFEKERLDLELLKELNKQDLRDLGIAQGDVIRILKQQQSTISDDRLSEYFNSKIATNTEPRPKKSPVSANDNFNSLRIQSTNQQQNQQQKQQQIQQHPQQSTQLQDTIITKQRDPIPPKIIQRQVTRSNSNTENSIVPQDSISQVEHISNSKSMNNISQQHYYNPGLANIQRQQQIRGNQPLVAQPVYQQPMQQQQRLTAMQQPMQQIQMGYQIGQQGQQLGQQMGVSNQRFVQGYMAMQPGPQVFPQGPQQGFIPSIFC